MLCFRSRGTLIKLEIFVSLSTNKPFLLNICIKYGFRWFVTKFNKNSNNFKYVIHNSPISNIKSLYQSSDKHTYIVINVYILSNIYKQIRTNDCAYKTILKVLEFALICVPRDRKETSKNDTWIVNLQILF